MYPTSAAYDALVYSRDYARQFIPEVIAKMMDLTARAASTYSSNGAAPWSDLEQLVDDIHVSDTYYRTLETGNFILDGTAQIVPADNEVTGQVGWVSLAICGVDGAFATPPTLTCNYSKLITTPGKTIFFDSHSQSFPVDFNVKYYDGTDTEVASKEVRGNTNPHFYTFEMSVLDYVKVVFTFLTMSIPETRVRIIEDVPGLYVQYFAEDVISMNFTQRVDVLSEEILTGEIDLTVRNDDRSLDILNVNGKGAFLQKRQPMDVNMYMVFPDGTTEMIPIGHFFLVTWSTDRETLAASFTLQDGLSKLNGRYTRGKYFPAQTTFYALAEDVFDAAGISDYWIDPMLLTFFTKGIIPLGTYKEALKLIAQATCSVVIADALGNVKIKYVGVYDPWPSAVDTLDYSVLINPPKVETTPHIKSLTTDIYSYVQEGSAEQLYQGTRSINGTETFTVEFTRPGANPSTTLSAGTLASIVYYARSALLTVTTTGVTDVTITVTGYVLTENKTQKTVTNVIDEDLIEDAEDAVVSNPLITSSGMADIVSAYVLFWKKRRYDYNIQWRGNPAAECLDPICVYDDFDNNNVTILLERDFGYRGGVLDATSKGRY